MVSCKPGWITVDTRLGDMSTNAVVVNKAQAKTPDGPPDCPRQLGGHMIYLQAVVVGMIAGERLDGLPRTVGSGRKASWGTELDGAPAEPQPAPVPYTAADRGREGRASGRAATRRADVPGHRRGLGNKRGDRPTSGPGIGPALSSVATMGQGPARSRQGPGREGKVHRASWSVTVDRAEGARRQESRHA